MTDKDSDDDNDRMERANRIREMREGRRRGADDDAEEPDSETATDEPADAESIEETDSTDGSEADSEPDVADDSDPAAESETDSEGEHVDDSEPEVESEGESDDEPVDESGFEFAGDDESETADDATSATAETGGAKVETTEPAAETEGATEATVESGVANSVADADAAAAVDNLGAGGTFAIPDQATTVTEEDEQAMLEEAEQSVAAARAAVAGRSAAHAADRTRVLEFDLGGERFCLDIDYIEEIVELENMTRVPNSPSYVEGVVDLRGQVTAIINPKDALDVDNETRGDLIIVFDSEELSEQGNLGWIVDDVRQVTPVSEEEVNESPDEEEHINGIINREDEDDFIVWTTPELALNSS
jgi:purine-binding chemotaxis protein CheW